MDLLIKHTKIRHQLHSLGYYTIKNELEDFLQILMHFLQRLKEVLRDMFSWGLVHVQWQFMLCIFVKGVNDKLTYKIWYTYTMELIFLKIHDLSFGKRKRNYQGSIYYLFSTRDLKFVGYPFSY